MNFTAPLPSPKTHAYTDTHADEAHGQPGFSRASHFALLLSPTALAVGVALFKDGDGTLLFRASVFGVLVFALMGLVSILHGIDLVQDSERR